MIIMTVIIIYAFLSSHVMSDIILPRFTDHRFSSFQSYSILRVMGPSKKPAEHEQLVCLQ